MKLFKKKSFFSTTRNSKGSGVRKVSVEPKDPPAALPSAQMNMNLNDYNVGCQVFSKSICDNTLIRFSGIEEVDNALQTKNFQESAWTIVKKSIGPDFAKRTNIPFKK